MENNNPDKDRENSKFRWLVLRYLQLMAPELKRYDSAAEKWSVRQRFGKEFRWNTSMIVVTVALGLVILAPSYLISLGMNSINLLSYCLLVGTPTLLYFFGLSMLSRNMWRKHVRMQLTKDGFPTCIFCGYDLRDNASDCCPECGAKIEKPDLKP